MNGTLEQLAGRGESTTVMENNYSLSPGDLVSYDNAKLRRSLLIEELFPIDAIRLVYSHSDRMLIGGTMPVSGPITFGSGNMLGKAYMLANREMGLACLSGPGRVIADDAVFEMQPRDILYIARGTEQIVLESDDLARPAQFYFISTLAGETYPSRLVTEAESMPITLGEAARCNVRTLRFYIHPQVAPSAMLQMGITEPGPGNVWNTMPGHMHENRTEIYMYFDMAGDDRVFHFIGTPGETRHLVVGPNEAVVNPPWSIHMGVGTGPYAYVWGMAGEDRDFGNVDQVALARMR